MQTVQTMRTKQPDDARRLRAMRRGAGIALVAMACSSLPHTSYAAPLVRVPASESTASDLEEGSIGPRVKEVQEALIAAGAFLPGGADGVYGAATTTAITHFQQWNGLERSGVLDAATLRRLELSSGATTSPPSSSSVDASSSSSSSTSSSYGSLAQGSTGDAVVELQRALLDTGLVIRGGADGVYGLSTRRALMAFQRVNGMAETGAMSNRAAQLLGLEGSNSQGSGESQDSSNQTSSDEWSSQVVERFPVQGYCGFTDTWHAPRGEGRLHEGVDIIAATGNLLYAVADGTITTQYWDRPELRAGNGLKLTAADGTYFVYLHMSGFAPGITTGTRVTAGDVIGFVGNTGSSATPHLHFEIHPGGGGPVNPYPYVKAIDDCSDTRAQYQSSFTSEG
jgi:murein DD-endopeptidase MepM/ murein hydrolase activator NlpD